LPVATQRSSRSSKTSGGRGSRVAPGDLAAAWMEASLVHGDGDLFGEPFRLTDDERRFLRSLYGQDRRGDRKVQRALLGRAKGYGKTELLAAIGLEQLCGPFAPPAPNIPVAAASFEQADLLFGTARVMVTEGPLAPYLEVYDTEILRGDGPGRMFRVAAAAGTNDGGRPTCFIADELHEWTGNKERVFLVISNSIAKRRNGLVLAITTAGAERDSLAGRMYDYGLEVRSKERKDPAFLFDWCEADGHLDPDDGPDVRAKMARQANPHLEQFGTLPFVERRYHEIAKHEWLRYFANRWVEADPESWLPDGVFEAGRKKGTKIDRTKPFVAAIDMALRHDTAALVAAQATDPAPKLVAESWNWVPDGVEALDIAGIERQIRELHATGNLRACAYDPAFFERSAQALLDDGVAMIEVPQSSARMVPACGHAYEVIVAGYVVHDFGVTATRQVVDAVPRVAGEGWRLSKGRSKKKIDTAIALVMAIDEATTRGATEANPAVGGDFDVEEYERALAELEEGELLALNDLDGR
jgi:phage terminase large subunit-like protein